MAIIFSLPWALLMWSYVIFCFLRRCTFMKLLFGDRMVIFFIALLLFCFSISNAPTRVFVAMMSVLMVTLIGWGIRTAWESEEDEDEVWEKSLAVFRRTRSVLFDRVKEVIPFHTRRFPDDAITLNSRNEGGV
jgi:hypothetical protein